MRIGLVIRYIGLALLLEALFLFLSAVVSAHNGFDESFMPLLFSGILASLLGAYPRIFVRKSGKLNSREGYIIVLCSWLLCCLFGAIPYVMYQLSFTDSLFESVSGFTTTGASVINDIEALPQGLLFWRMSTAWIGGIGIVALFSLIVPNVSGNGSTLSGAEVSDIARQYSTMKQRSFVSVMIYTYITLTVISILALKLGGMRWFDAATHAMSACSTCGFSTKNSSIAEFDSPLLEVLLSAIMIIASMRFVLLSTAFRKGGIKRIVKSEITRIFLAMIGIGIAAIAVGLMLNGQYDSIWGCLRAALFQVSSIFTTTGFATADTNTWPAVCKSLLVAGSFICGCSGSTSGGIKVDRFAIACKSIAIRVANLQSPRTVKALRVDKSIISDSATNSVLVFIITYLFIVCIGAVIYSSMGLGLQTAWSASIACMGNVGPGFGEIGSMDNYAGLPYPGKYLSIMLMLIGRLEIFPFLFLLGLRRVK